jgi:SAM-dependent methyltransferase
VSDADDGTDTVAEAADGGSGTDGRSGTDDGAGGDTAARQRRAVRERYAGVATGGDGTGDGADSAGSSGAEDACCGPATEATADATSNGAGDGATGDGGCCGPAPAAATDEDDPDGDADDDASEFVADGDAAAMARRLGYDEADLETAGATEANLGLGCGNPEAIANLRPGETVLDLGSGGGFDCFLAADAVGPSGRAIGVDMTPEMVERARSTARDRTAPEAAPVEFRLGEIEHLPVADGVVDVVISNCVINLSPAKPQVFREAYRVLRPGGRLAVSDVVATAPVPDAVRADLRAVSGCVGGAAQVEDLRGMLADAGFVDVAVDPDADGEAVIDAWGVVDGDGDGVCADTDTGTGASREDADGLAPSAYVSPASIRARKPADASGREDR